MIYDAVYQMSLSLIGIYFSPFFFEHIVYSNFIKINFLKIACIIPDWCALKGPRMWLSQLSSEYLVSNVWSTQLHCIKIEFVIKEIIIKTVFSADMTLNLTKKTYLSEPD